MTQSLRGSYKWEDAVYKNMRAQNSSERETFGVACNVMLDKLLSLPGVPQSGTLLEIGTGDGYNTIHLARRSYGVTTIEISEHALHLAQARFEREQLNHIRLLQMDATAMTGLEDDSFDVVVDSTCLHCVLDLGDRSKLLREVNRVLKGKGSFIGATLSQPYVESLPADIYAEGEILYGDFAHQGRMLPVRRVRTAAQLQAELAANGLALAWSEHKIIRKEPICYHFAYHARKS